MTWVDAAVLGVIAISGLLAFVRGFVREVLGIGAWIGALLAALWAYPDAQPVVARYISNPDLVMPVTYAAIFVVVLIVLLMISHWIGALVRSSALGGVDRSLGLLFGLARGVALVVGAYIGLSWLPSERWPEPVRQARALQFAYESANWAMAQLPENYRPHVAPPPTTPEPTAEAMMHATPAGRASDKPQQRP